MDSRPPKLALKLLRWYCSELMLEELEGDLVEQFEIDSELGRKFPKLRFWWNVIRCAKSYAIKSKRYSSKTGRTMLKTNIILSLRNFRKNPLYGSLNLMGLSLAVAAFGLIGIYLHYELSFEDFHENREHIYRVTYKTASSNGTTHWARVPVDYINQIPDEISGIEALVRFQNHEQKYFKIGTRNFIEDHVYQTDPEVFDLFSFHFVEGDPESALVNPKSIVITESLSQKYFGEKDGLGKEISIAGEWHPEAVRYKITGVIRDMPKNTHIPINALISFDSPEQRTWWAYSYISVHEGVELTTLNQTIEEFVTKHTANEIQKESLVLQPIEDIHLTSKLAREIVPNGSLQNIKIFVCIGLMILFIGLINFTNLSAVAYLSRMKEVGVRKALGAFNRQIAAAAITETTLYGTCSFLIGSGLIILFYPSFREFTGAVLVMDWFIFAVLLLGITLLIGLTAGIYPASISSKLKALHLIKKHLPTYSALGTTSFGIKKIMLTAQFAIAILLICSALIASDQFIFMNAKNLKMKAEQVLTMPRIPNNIKDQYLVLKEKLSGLPGVQSVSACMQVPSSEIRDAGFFKVSGLHSSRDEAPTFDIQVVGHDFFEVMNIDLLEGTFFPANITPKVCPQFTEEYTYQQYLAEQPRAYIINETALRALGMAHPSEVLGKQASFELVTELKEGPIVGVIEDYHQASLKNSIDPTIYVYEPLWMGTILIRMETADVVNVIGSVEASWNELFPNFKLEYEFLDQLYEHQYKSERKQLALLSIFSMLAIMIAFLGIFGLVAYVLKTKMKELAIRKVLGANPISLIRLVGIEYFLLLGVGLVISVPLGIYSMNSWLDNFAYRIEISPLNFIISFMVMIVLMGSTIGFQTLRTSTANPVDSLRDD